MPDARPYARLKEGLFPVGLLVFTVFIFAPFTIYFWNPGELDVGYFSVLTTLSPLALLAAVVLLIPACLLPARGFRFYNPLLLGLGVALWLQGSVMVGSYGLLDGTRIDFAAQNWRAWHETAVWAGLPALVIIFYPGHKRTMLSGARLVLSLEVLFVVAGGLAYPASFKPWELDSLPADASVLSSRDNILHIVLDGFQSDAFAEVLERFPEFADAFEGFVFYENSMGLFPTTRMSIPAMLTGEVYRNQVPMDEFISVVMSSRTLPATLHQSGYLVDMLTLRQYRYGEDYSNWYSVPRPFSAEKQRRRFAAAEVLDLSLFRHLPHLVKPWIYRNQSWLLQAWGPLNVPADRKFAPSNSVAFMQHYRSRLRVGDEQPRYKFIHLFLPHLPLVLDSGCKFLGTRPQSREAFVEQSACAVRVVSDFLNDLRARGVYENALIVISADHGNRFPSELVSSQFEDAQVASRATALLLIKTPGAREELVTSAAPVTLSDIPATIAELTGIPNRFPGRSALQLRAGDRRDRRFYYYIWRGGYWNYDFLPELREYVVSGDVFDPGAWQFQGLVQPREGAPESSFIRVDLGTERHRKFLESGWGRDRKNGKTTYVRAIGKTARVRLPLISQADTLVTARLAPAPEDRTQVISVVVDGKEITRWKANPGSGWRVYSAIIPTSSRIRREVTIQFNFAEVSSPDNLAAGCFSSAQPPRPITTPCYDPEEYA